MSNTNYNFYTGEIGSDIAITPNISFIGNAVDYLSAEKADFNLNEWVWHEEVINGEKHCVVTDKIYCVNFKLD